MESSRANHKSNRKNAERIKNELGVLIESAIKLRGGKQYIMRNERNNSNLYDIRMLTSSDIYQLFDLHQMILAQLPHPHVLRPDSQDFLLRNIELTGRTFGAFYENALIAYASVSFPNCAERNLAYDLLHLEIEPEKVVIYDGSAVHPNHRGKRLHILLNDVRRKFAVEAGYYHFMGTVSPFNPYSLLNHLKADFLIKAITVKYDGMLRYIIHKDLRHSPVMDSSNAIEIRITNLKMQKKAINEGFWGYGLKKEKEEVRIQYARFSSFKKQ